MNHDSLIDYSDRPTIGVVTVDVDRMPVDVQPYWLYAKTIVLHTCYANNNKDNKKPSQQ